MTFEEWFDGEDCFDWEFACACDRHSRCIDDQPPCEGVVKELQRQAWNQCEKSQQQKIDKLKDLLKRTLLHIQDSRGGHAWWIKNHELCIEILYTLKDGKE